LSTEKGICNGLQAGILRVEASNGEGGTVADIEVEMDETAGEDKQISLVQDRGIELVVGVDEASVKRALRNVQDLGGSWVGVGRDESAFGIVKPREPQSLRVQSRVVHACEARADCRSQRVARVACLLEAGEFEVGSRDGRRVYTYQPVDDEIAAQVRYTKIVDRIRIRRQYIRRRRQQQQQRPSYNKCEQKLRHNSRSPVLLYLPVARCTLDQSLQQLLC